MLNVQPSHPLADFLGNPNAYVERLSESGSPEILTVDGHDRLVIQDATSYRRMLDELEESRLLVSLNEGVDDCLASKSRPIGVAFRELKASHDL